jgi:DUF1680 family protein
MAATLSIVVVLAGMAGGAAEVIPSVVRPLPLSEVRLTDGPLKRVQDLNARYLLALDPNRMLAGYRVRAGLAPKAPGYGGWDAIEGKQLTGHIAGHYLSAVSLMALATDDPRFKERADYLVAELKEVQQKNGDGYLGALDQGRERFAEIARGDIRSTGFDLNGLWSPWYVLHKTFAGLRDAFRSLGNRDALQVEIGFARWAEGIMATLSDAQVQRMLNTEFGGMNEIFADLYVDTGDVRWLDLSRRFEHRVFTEPLMRHQDRLGGTHGNTQVPKMLGSLSRFIATGDSADGFAASFFWDRVVQHHSYATGGHGKDEYFGDADRLNDRVDGRTAETCNVYNMLKMERRLFALRPDPYYADFQERALFNHILASLEPEQGWACYMVPVGRGVQREYERQMLDGGFTCCTGSSMESHALHGDGLYYEVGNQLWVNLYVPSIATWKGAGATLSMETDFPEGESATLSLKLAEPRELTLHLRRPFWAGPGFVVRVNGQEVAESKAETKESTTRGPSTGRATSETPGPSTFIALKRRWSNGDSISIALPKQLRAEPVPDNPHRVALMWGPLVLAGDLGPDETSGEKELGRGRSRLDDLPVLVSANDDVSSWVTPLADRPGCFRAVGRNSVGEVNVDLVPFYRLHRRTYAAYWDRFTPSEWTERSAELGATRERQRKLEAATVGQVQPGEMQAERDANMQGERTSPERLMGRPGRRGAGWFSFELSVDPSHPAALVATYNHDEWQRREFEVLVDGQRLAEQVIERRGPLEFFDVEYPVPPDWIRDKKKIEVKFRAKAGSEIGAVYGLRVVRSDLAR